MIRATLTDPDGKVLRAAYDHDGQLSADGLLTQLDGFVGGVGVAVERISRASGPGDFATDTRRTTRALTFGALYEPETRQDNWEIQRHASGLFQNGGTSRLVVELDGEPMTLYVDLDGDVKIDANLDAGTVEVQVPLIANDPRMYGPERKTYLYPIGTGIGLAYPLGAQVKNPAGEAVLSYGAGITSQDPITNGGNATNWPTFVVVGDFPSGFTLKSGRSVFSWPHPTAPASPVTIDMSGSVLVNGIDQSALVGRREWFGVRPGRTIYPIFEPVQYGTGYCEVISHDTYL